MAFVDITGRKFGRYTVEGLDKTSRKVMYWHCLCECGTRKRVFGGDLKRGNTKSCGCLALEERISRMTTHGMSRHPAYKNWMQAKTRCEDTNSAEYVNYGGRGIKICARWRDFAKFWEDMGPSWSEGLTLDRIKNGRGYQPTNCRWATPKEQANNRRNNNMIDTPKGVMTVSQAAEAFGMKRATIQTRLRAGWPSRELFSPPRFNMRWHNEQETT